MSSLVEEAIEVLYTAQIPLAPGLSHGQIEAVEQRFSFKFNPDHAALLSLAMPIGYGWVDWLGAPEEIQERQDAPRKGVLFDVGNNEFWPEVWGAKPSETELAVEVARARLCDVPALIPVFIHRCMPAAPAPAGSPVFSVHQTDVIYYGSDLKSYFLAEFLGIDDQKPTKYRVDFWSDLAEGRWL